MIVRAMQRDIDAVTALARLLWPEPDAAELRGECESLLSDGDAAVFLCWEAGTAVGFAQCQLRRDYVEGTHGAPVGYLEGIYVREAFRGRGFAKALICACEDWARERGCMELASDCELENQGSLRFHLAAGFAEANRVICFVKRL